MASALDVIRVVARMALLGQEILNVYHFVSSSSVPDGDVLGELATFVSELHTNINASIVSGLAYTDISMTNVTDNSDIGIIDWDGLTVGGSGGDMLPSGVAALVTIPTENLGTRGRKFIAGFGEGNTTGGVFSGTVLTSLNLYGVDLISGFIGSISGEPWGYVVYNQFGVPVVPTDYIVSNVPAYQRRRKVGVGI